MSDKIKNWLADGNCNLEEQGIETVEELLEAAGRLMDKAYAQDIVGHVIFEGEDGKFYKGTIQFVLDEMDDDEVKEAKDQFGEEGDEEP